MSGIHIGIDLGTTFSCVGVWKKSFEESLGDVQIINNEYAKSVTPSVVVFDGNDVYVGNKALRNISKNPKNSITAVKRLIGRRFSEDAVKDHLHDYTYDIVDKDGKAYVEVDYEGKRQLFSPEDISGLILKKMKDIAANIYNQEILSTVITVPAYFTEPQRQATISAAEKAGFSNYHILNEPTAAAIAYGIQMKRGGELNDGNSEVILVYDLGGGTFDVSILKTDGIEFDVIRHGGESRLGGEDFDQRLIRHLLEKFKGEHGNVDISDRKLLELREKCEQAKLEISAGLEAEIEIPYFYEEHDLKYTISRAEFEDLCDDLFRKTIDVLNRVIEESEVSKAEIDEIVLVGGGTKMPRVRELVSDYFGGKQIKANINSAEAVAIGASIWSMSLYRAASETSREVWKEDGTELALVKEKNAHALGVRIIGDKMSVIIPGNSKLPIIRSGDYTNSGYSDMVSLDVYEGDSEETVDNFKLGSYDIRAARVVPPDTLKINVVFRLDVQGTLHISASENVDGDSIQGSLQVKRH